MTIIGQIFSFIGALLMAYSVFSKSKKNMISLQCCTNISCILANFFLKGYPGIVANTLLATRNILEIKNKLTKTATTIICILIILVGLYFNNRGLYGLFPVMSSTLFVIFTHIIKTAQKMRICIAVTMLLWFFYDFHIKSYPLAILDIIIIVMSIFEYIRVFLKNKKDIKIEKI